MTRTAVLTALLILVMVGAATALWFSLDSRPRQLTLVFHPSVGEDVLVLGEPRYDNPGGEGKFGIRSFQFFLSNIRLLGASGNYVEPDSYHLVRFDSGDGSYRITLGDLPGLDYQHIEFGIGVDPSANGTITVSGDLDPNGRMAWSWDVGYKFLLFEGGLVTGRGQTPLVYHIGFDENYRIFSAPLPPQLGESQAAKLDFRVDILSVFRGEHTVDMVALSNVKFDRSDARLLAENYSDMLSLLP